MVFDEAKIYVRSGDGGDGMMSFRREKYVPFGGPNGGDGGRGGDVILRVNPRMNTLTYFQTRVHFKADHGKRGGSARKTGASADAKIIDVPPGTIVRDAKTHTLLADLVNEDAEVIVAKGGRGGRGNTRFVSASNQAPRMAEKGEPGVERRLHLELRLIADVGLVGVPNAGKSTLLSVISNAKPKIADYPFTTLEPNLGVVVYDDRDIVVADIPGLIEGAHMGLGLGHSFLRHVQRTRMLVHILDGTSMNFLADYSQITTELALYDDRLIDKPQIVVVNKMDIPEVQELWPEIKAELETLDIAPLPVSAITQTNIHQLIQRMFGIIAALPKEKPVDVIVEPPLYELEEDGIEFEISHDPDGSYRVAGYHIERAASMTYWDYEEAVNRFQNILETLGVSAALIRAGIQVGDTVYIGDYELEWSE